MNLVKKIPQIDFRLIRNFLVYSSGSLVLKIITATIGLITIRFLTPQEFGLLSLLNNFILILPLIMNLGLRQAYGVDFYHLSLQDKKKHLNNIIGLYLTIAVPIFIICLIFANKINKFIFFDNADFHLIVTALATAFFHFFFEFYLQLLRYRCKIYALTAAQIGIALVNIICTALLVYILKLKILGILLANFISMLSLIIYAFFDYVQKLKLEKFKIYHFKEKTFYYLKTGFPFIPSVFFTWILSYGNRWFLAKYANMHDVGIYSLADYFAQIFNLVILYPISATYVPYIFNKFAASKDNILELDSQNKQNMYFAMIVMVILISVSFFIAKNILYIILPISYFKSIQYIWFLLFGQIFFMGSYFATCYLQFIKRNYLLLSFTISGSLICCLLNFILTPRFGIYGAITASNCGYILYFLLIIIFTNIIKKNHLQEMSKLEKCFTELKS